MTKITDTTNNSTSRTYYWSLIRTARLTVLFTVTVVIGTGSTLFLTAKIHSQYVDPAILSSVWPIAATLVTTVIITGTIITITVIRFFLAPSQTDTRHSTETGQVIGIAGLIGTTVGTIAAATNSTTTVVSTPIVSGNESYLAVTIAAILYGIVWYEYYRPHLTHVALERVVSIEPQEHDPEFVRDKTAQWDTDANRSDRNVQYQHVQQRHIQKQRSGPQQDQGQYFEQSSDIDGEDDEEIDISDTEYRWDTSGGPGFDAVGGMQSVKNELRRDVIIPLTTQREKADELGISPPNIIFYGPPGTGKSFIAEALAEELGLPFARLSGADVQSKWINESAKKVQSLFREAESIAEQVGGAVVFLDELDSVLKTRNGAGSAHEEDNKVVNEFLNHLEDTAEDNVVFIGATNRLDALDDAGIRAGRIDKKIEVGTPDAEARAAVLEVQLDELPHNLTGSDIEQLAQEMDGYVPADIERVVEDSAKRILYREQEAIARRDVAAVINRD
jgi:ATP-dependent 26S proteasome regulatory subunit